MTRGTIDRVPIEQFVRDASQFYGVPSRFIWSDMRTDDVVSARYLAIWNATHEGWSMAEIGRALRKTPSAIFYALEKMGLKPPMNREKQGITQ